MTVRDRERIYRDVPREQREQLKRFREQHPRRRLTVGDLEWEYVVGGRGEETVVILVGGSRSSETAFRLILALENERKVIAPVYPCADTMSQLTEGIAAILDAEGVRRAHVWGSSFGGMLVQCFVRRYPERAISMIAGDTAVPDPALEQKERRQGILLRIIPLRLIRPLARRQMYRVITSAVPVADRSFWCAFIDEWLITEYTREWLLASRKCIMDYCRSCAFTPKDLKSWPGRVLIVDSSDDDTIGARQREALREMYPRSHVYAFQGAGHAPVVTREQEYIAVVRGFLDSGKPPAPGLR
jgi:pimeloyl-ACP methyl ester carboxylesterase